MDFEIFDYSAYKGKPKREKEYYSCSVNKIGSVTFNKKLVMDVIKDNDRVLFALIKPDSFAIKFAKEDARGIKISLNKNGISRHCSGSSFFNTHFNLESIAGSYKLILDNKSGFYKAVKMDKSNDSQ